MELKQIDCFCRQILQAAIHKCCEVFTIVAFERLCKQAPSGLGSDMNLFASASPHPGDEPLASAIAINVRRIYKIDAQIDRPLERSQRFLVFDRSPGAPDRPGAEAHSRNVPTGA